MSNHWSPKELRLLVRDYFAMLRAQEAGQTYKKSEHRRHLLPHLDSRSEGSIERKHQNVSAILRELGRDFISGYKPLGNYQAALKNTVLEYLREHVMEKIMDPKLKAQYAFRDQLGQELAKDLIGPKTTDEIIDDPPLTEYIIGILYPSRSGTIQPADHVDDTDEDEDGRADPAVALANVKYPSSLGATFALAADTKAIAVEISTAKYVPVDSEGNEEERKTPSGRWKRIPLTATIQLSMDSITDGRRESGIEGLHLYSRVRPKVDGVIPVTLVLLNTRVSETGFRDADSFFQVKMKVQEPNGCAVFVQRPDAGAFGGDEDLRSYRLLYRHARQFATGHGCSVNWAVDTSVDERRAVLVETTHAPSYDVPLAQSNPKISSEATGLNFLSTASRAEVVGRLNTLCEGYEAWISMERKAVLVDEDLDPVQQETAEENLLSCGDALDRMREGIQLLKTDQTGFRAFQLMNEVMLQQRARAVWLGNGRPSDGPENRGSHAWRPFQLAFILVCLRGIADPDSKDREIADLLWFPTGGGKTEAYLGLIAYTIFLRRLRHPRRGAGVTAIMRYTLRLLTIQQFERAALLVCCCEFKRRASKELGAEPISIGLWLGQGSTPNTLSEAKTSLGKLRQGVDVETKNPVQLHSCPWCGNELTHRDYWIHDQNKRLMVTCHNKNCDYASGLPVHLVDDDVYKARPTLLIATVDKFAGLPWREKSAHLFNLGANGAPEMARPELIIQDELHLISGPLGTLVGLYETVIDELCSDGGVRPKIVASTATIRRAKHQSRGLFNREVRQFPPPGTDARDSYFAVEAPKSEKGTRRYVGLMAPGTSHTTLLVRSYAALLQRCLELEGEDEIRDPYWTLVGYFNSLRVLGGARMQVQDDVNDRMELLAAAAGVEKRDIDERIELTSRESSTSIPSHLKRMARSYGQGALDVILATNMISVGVDIDRLGLMVVMGQPGSSSEYIQSTSRVGRRYPGLVVVLFNAARSRDRSHYESFKDFHSAMYRQVESTSVTPFSSRARDRALHAVLLALVRLKIPGMRENDSAGQIGQYREQVEAICKEISERVGEVAEDERAATERQLAEIVEEWLRRGSEGPLYYRDQDPNQALLIPASGESSESEAYPTMWSMRDVDQESNLFLVRGGR